MENEKEFTKHAISNSTFGHYRQQQKKIAKAKELLKENGILDVDELSWYRTYGEYINKNFPNVDAEASAYSDGDTE